jgi:DNA-binding FadR family transcriptional regulator
LGGGRTQGGRYTVIDLSPSRLVAPFNVMLSSGDYDVEEHFEARTVVDLELVRLCTERATDEQPQRIYQHAIDGKVFYNEIPSPSACSISPFFFAHRSDV